MFPTTLSFPRIPPCISTIHWSFHFTVGGWRAYRKEALCGSLELECNPRPYQHAAASVNEKYMCLWRHCKPVHVDHHHCSPSSVREACIQYHCVHRVMQYIIYIRDVYLLFSHHWKIGLNCMFQTNPVPRWWIEKLHLSCCLQFVYHCCLHNHCLGKFFLPHGLQFPCNSSRGLGCCTKQLPSLEGEIELSS